MQGWLRHAQLTTTLNVYIHDVDAGLGDASVWDTMLEAGGPNGGPTSPDSTVIEHSETVR